MSPRLLTCAIMLLAASSVASASETYPLARFGTELGQVSVWNDSTTVYVDVEAAAGHKIVLVKAAAAATLETLPTRGDPAKRVKLNASAFPVQESYSPMVDAATGLEVMHEEAGLPEGDTITIALYAQMKYQTEVRPDVYRWKTTWAWAGEEIIPREARATYLTYTIPSTAATLPDTITYRHFKGGDLKNPDIPAFWKVEVLGAEGDDESFSLGIYAGNCMQKNLPIKAKKTYTGKVIDPMNDEVPDRFKHIPFDKLNYVINHENGNTPLAVQQVIWAFTGDLDPLKLPTAAKALYRDADANGAGYDPNDDDDLDFPPRLHVLIDPGPWIQATLLRRPINYWTIWG